MTATEQLIAKQVSDVFPASVDDLPLADAARRGLIAPLRSLRVPPAAAIHTVPIVGGDFEERALAQALDHQALNQAAASLYRDRFAETPGIVYAAGVDHAYNLAQEFRAVDLKAVAVSGRTPPVQLAETLAAYERGEINVLINAMLLAEGWNSPRATVCMHLAPTASRRVYQQRVGRIMRIHPRKEAGVVIDFVPKGATHHVRGREPEPAAADDRARRPRGDDRRARRLRRPGYAGDAGADLGEGPAAGRANPPAGALRRTRRRAGADSRALDLAARPRDAEGAGPARERGVPGGEAAPRCARQLARPPARGERGEARELGARAARAGGRRSPRLGRGLYPAREPAHRRGPGAHRAAAGDRRRAG